MDTKEEYKCSRLSYKTFSKQNQLQKSFPTKGPSMLDIGCPFI